MSEPGAVTTEQIGHFPGPWMVGDVSKNENPLMVYCDDALGSRVADCSTSGHGITHMQDIANGRLIAAAPELLESLKAFLKAFGSTDEMSIKARFAIAKVEGKL